MGLILASLQLVGQIQPQVTLTLAGGVSGYLIGTRRAQHSPRPMLRSVVFRALVACSPPRPCPVAPTASLPRARSRSIGLDRPLVNILREVKAALDPTGATLTTWSSTTVPCALTGTAWAGIACASTYVAPSATRSLSALFGGISALTLSSVAPLLSGTLPPQLAELLTCTTIDISSNALVGSMPPYWCAKSAKSLFPAAATTSAKALSCLTIAAPDGRSGAGESCASGRTWRPRPRASTAW